MSNAEDIVVIKPKRLNPLFLICMLLLLSFITYLSISQIVQHPDKWVNWFHIAGLILLWIPLISFVVYRKKWSQALTLKLTHEGLTKGKTLCLWHNIDQFGITREHTTFFSSLLYNNVIFWNYKPSSSDRQFSQKITRLFAGYDVGVLANYEVRAEDIVKMLNDWKIRYTGQASEIKYGGGLSRNLTKRELIIIGGGLIIFLVLLFTILIGYVTRNEKIESHDKQIQQMRNTPR